MSPFPKELVPGTNFHPLDHKRILRKKMVPGTNFGGAAA